MIRLCESGDNREVPQVGRNGIGLKMMPKSTEDCRARGRRIIAFLHIIIKNQELTPNVFCLIISI